MSIKLLNALVTSSKMPMTLRTRPATLDEVKRLLENREIESYIGHEATAKLLTTLLSIDIMMCRAMYDPRPNDIAIVVRMKKRLEKPEDVKNITINDVEFILVEYSEYK